VAETGYRQELRPVLQEGAEVIDRLFRSLNGDTPTSGPKKRSRRTSSTSATRPGRTDRDPPSGDRAR